MSSDSTEFTSKLGVLFATLGSAVGLGNIWKFPALTGENGGAAFVLVYIIACVLLGLPLMIAEISLGRKGGSDIFKTMQRLEKKTAWKIIPILALFSGGLVLAFYTDVAGWVGTYLVKALTGELNTTDPLVAKGIFEHVISTPYIALLGQLSVFIIIGGVLAFGVHAGIERVTKVLLPVLAILLLGIAINNLFLEKATEGLAFLFKPDFSKITSTVILEAVGLAFFKLSLGMGTMLTYGSYFPKNQNIPLVATRVMFADLIISLIAGVAIFPAVFTYGFEVTSGTSLLFVTIPAVFSSMPFGNVITALFFLLTIFATFGASIALLEVVVAVLIGKGYSRSKSVCIAISVLFFFGIFATLSLTPILSEYTFFDKNIFSLYDFASSNILMPLGGLFIALFIGWNMKKEDIITEITNNGVLYQNTYLVQSWFILIRYVVPVLILIVLFNGLKLWTLLENIF